MRGPIHEQLRDARKKKGKTGEEIAAAAGWKRPSQVSNVEAGRRDTQLSEAAKWAEACGYELALIPTGDADPEGLAALIAEMEDPAARGIVAELARLTRRPHRYWMRLLLDIRHYEARAEQDALDGLD